MFGRFTKWLNKTGPNVSGLGPKLPQPLLINNKKLVSKPFSKPIRNLLQNLWMKPKLRRCPPFFFRTQDNLFSQLDRHYGSGSSYLYLPPTFSPSAKLRQKPLWTNKKKKEIKHPSPSRRARKFH